MSGDAIERATAILAAGALVAALATITLDAPASAAKPKCGGKVATIVGTKRGEVIKGTAKADVIVARGGHDRIYGKGGNDTICAGLGHDKVYAGPGADRVFGQAGRDRLNGGPGPDFLAGQLDNDTLNGGIGVDTCHQGPGSGPVVRCERPLPPPAAPVAPQPPAKVLVRAFSDLNGDHLFNAGDVVISQLVDTNGDGVPSAGDTIEMGKYPTEVVPSIPAHFADWRVRSHVVATVGTNEPDRVAVMTEALTVHRWLVLGGEIADEYWEEGSGTSYIRDRDPDQDWIWMEVDSPSLPGGNLQLSNGGGTHDDRLIDVDIYR
jgi:hypothetical protein